MSLPEPSPFPLVGLHPVANAQNQWVALLFDVPSDSGNALQALLTLFSYPDMRAALAPLDCIVPLTHPLQFDTGHRATLSPGQVVFRLPAAACAEVPIQKKCQELAEQGYRLYSEGDAGVHASAAAMSGLIWDAGTPMPSALAMFATPGPHIARGVHTPQAFDECRAAGFSWFSGDYALQSRDDVPANDGTTRQRLLALLGLLARDADSRELEVLLKQDPALAYQLLKLVNSAAFALSSPIHSFGQAINILGRRQLQRWLQLLLYARQQDDGEANPLLPLAAVRAAQMEALVKARGGDRDAQDMAFVAGVFSLLDVLLGMPMTEIVSALSLDLDVVMALLDRTGPLGDLLRIVERPHTDTALLDAAGIDAETYWRSLLLAYHCAIQVSRTL